MYTSYGPLAGLQSSPLAVPAAILHSPRLRWSAVDCRGALSSWIPAAASKRKRVDEGPQLGLRTGRVDASVLPASEDDMDLDSSWGAEQGLIGLAGWLMLDMGTKQEQPPQGCY